MTHGYEPRRRTIPAPLCQAFLLAAAALLVSPGCASDIVLDRTASSANGMVVCVDDLAASAGARILADGGNAVDAAVAVAFALAVTHPQAGNLGGGGFMLMRLADGTLTCVDYRETAPRLATAEMFLEPGGEVDEARRDLGFLCAGVPGTVAGLELAHRRYGRLPWRQLVEPAVRLAEDGFIVDADLAKAFEKHEKKLRLFETTVRAYFGEGQERLEEGDRLKQPDLAATLARIRDRGAGGFYGGETAAELVRATQAGGGIMTLEDVATYRPKERPPVTGRFRGFTVVGAPLPTSGGTILIEMLNILSGFDLAKMDEGSRLHLLAEAMRRAFRDRALFLGDPDFVDAPIDRLLSPEHAGSLAAGIDAARATDSHAIAEGVTVAAPPAGAGRNQGAAGGGQTTHFSVADAEGNVAANTYTLEESFGSKAVAGATGVLMNNEMHDFNLRPGWTDEAGAIGTPPNLIAPGKRMLSSMCPVILLRDGRPYAVLGSPGGRTIINTVLQVILNLVELGLQPEEAVAAPRIHHQWFPDRLQVERTLPEATRRSLAAKGHELKETESQGDCHLIVVDPGLGIMWGFADRRIDGHAAGVARKVQALPAVDR